MNRTFVIGVGMSKFEKPGTKEGDYPDWAAEAGIKGARGRRDPVRRRSSRPTPATSTATPPTGSGRSTGSGSPGIPVVNVNNNCSTGSSALFLARQAVRGGLIDCALAVGFEKMERGSLGIKYTDRTPATRQARDAHVRSCATPRTRRWPRRCSATPGATTWRRYGSKPEHYVWIGWKNHKHSVNNPYAQFQTEYSLEDIAGAPMIHEPLTKLQCSPTSDGAAAAVVASERFVDEHGLWEQADGNRRAVDGDGPPERASTRTPTASGSSATT